MWYAYSLQARSRPNYDSVAVCCCVLYNTQDDVFMWNGLRLFGPFLILCCWVAPGGAAQAPKLGDSVVADSAAVIEGARRDGSRPFSAIYGIVTDSAGQPVSDATIEISGKKPFSVFSMRSSSTGMFHIDSLVPGETYTVAVTRFGFRATESQPFIARADSTRSITVVLHPRRTVIISAQGARQSKKPLAKPNSSER